MANLVKLKIVTPSKIFYEGDVRMVIVRTVEGDEGFMAGHEWCYKLLQVGEMWIQETEAEEYRIAAIAGGYVEVKESVNIYTDAAEWAEDIDMDRVLKEKENAEDWLTSQPADNPIYVQRANIAVQKSINRMNVHAGGIRHTKGKK